MGKSSLVSLLVGCALIVSTGSVLSCPGLPLDALTEFVSGEDIPESVTADRYGNLYISNGNTVLKRTVSGEIGLYATLPLPIFALGVKVGPDDCLYVASTSLSAEPGAFVWRACEPDSIEVFAELDHDGAPNDLAFDAWGRLFVSDPRLGQVWLVDPEGAPTVLVADQLLAGDPANPALIFSPLGANGIAVDRHNRYLYLSNTDQGSIVRVSLSAPEPVPALFVQDERLRGADGIAFDRAGTLFVAVNATDLLATVSPAGHVRVLASGAPLDAPSSLVFGALHDDRHQLYVTSSAFSRTLGLQTGTPHPALLGASVRTPGLTLP